MAEGNGSLLGFIEDGCCTAWDFGAIFALILIAYFLELRSMLSSHFFHCGISMDTSVCVLRNMIRTRLINIPNLQFRKVLAMIASVFFPFMDIMCFKDGIWNRFKWKSWFTSNWTDVRYLINLFENHFSFGTLSIIIHHWIIHNFLR